MPDLMVAKVLVVVAKVQVLAGDSESPIVLMGIVMAKQAEAREKQGPGMLASFSWLVARRTL